MHKYATVNVIGFSLKMNFQSGTMIWLLLLILPIWK